jgi:uncharacterized membrane protein YkvI
VFGGAYSTGREVLEFMSKNGPWGGLISLLTITITYIVILFLCFELARRYEAYDYRAFFKVLLGRAWFLYEILITIGLILTLAICSSATGNIAKEHFGVSVYLGGFIMLLIVVILNYFGREIVEKSMIYTVIALGLLVAYLCFRLFGTFGTEIAETFSTNSASNVTQSVKSGLIYAFTVTGFIPMIIFCGRDLFSINESLLAGFAAGIVAVLPGLAFHLCFMAFYPGIVDATVPTYLVIEKATSGLFLNLYVVVVFVLIALTGVGLLQGVLQRMDNWMQESSGRVLTPANHALISGLALIASSGLATVGLVDLIIKGFTFFSISFTLIFFIPLFTIGIYKIFFVPIEPVTTAS